MLYWWCLALSAFKPMLPCHGNIGLKVDKARHHHMFDVQKRLCKMVLNLYVNYITICTSYSAKALILSCLCRVDEV